jgi:hypothetical protein
VGIKRRAYRLCVGIVVAAPRPSGDAKEATVNMGKAHLIEDL